MHPRTEVLVCFCGPSLHAIEFIEFRRPRTPTTNHIPVPDSNGAATHRQTQAFLAVTQRLCGSFQIGNIRNRRNPARDLAFAIAPRLVHDVIEPWLAIRNRNLHVELDTFAAQDTLDIRADHLERLATHHIDHWTSDDLFSRQPDQLLVCMVAGEVALITATTRKSYRSPV